VVHTGAGGGAHEAEPRLLAWWRTGTGTDGGGGRTKHEQRRCGLGSREFIGHAGADAGEKIRASYWGTGGARRV
jgi:hypothetical protein